MGEKNLGRPAFSEISPDDLRLLNYLLILDAFRDSLRNSGLAWLFMPSRQQCTFNEYVSAWLSDLVEVGINPAGLPAPTPVDNVAKLPESEV